MENLSAKNYFWILLDLLLAGIIVNLVFFVMPAVSEYRNSLSPSRTIVVSAEGKAVVSPDIAEISFSVLSRGQNPETVSSANNEKMSAVIVNLKSQGIDEKDIKTTSYDLSPNYDYDKNTGKSYIYGYSLSQTTLVKIRDLKKVAAVIGGLTPLGVNQIGTVSFTVDDPEKFLAEARKDAFKKAGVKAAEMVLQNGVRLGRVLSISEYQNVPIPFMSKPSFAMSAMSAAPAPAIETGIQEVKVQVSVTYVLE